MKAAVFFDRDGVLNRACLLNGRPRAPLRIEDFEISPEAEKAVRAVLEGGFLAIGITNQPELASGELSAEILEKMHNQLFERVPLTTMYVCPHDAADDCGCHKPKPGLLERARDEYGIDLRASFLIGDRWRDIEAGNAAGCTTVLIRRPYSGKCQPAHIVSNLPQAVSWVLGRRR